MESLRILRVPSIAVGTYLAATKVTNVIVGDQPYEANILFKALAHVLCVRGNHILPSPTPWIYSRQYLECLGHNPEICMAKFLAAMELDSYTNGGISALTSTSSSSSPKDITSFLVNIFENINTEPVIYATVGAVMYDILVSRSRGYVYPTALRAWNMLEEDSDLFFRNQYYDAVMETYGVAAHTESQAAAVEKAPMDSAPPSVCDGKAGAEEVNDNDPFLDDVQAQIRHLSSMLDNIDAKHRQDIEKVQQACSVRIKNLRCKLRETNTAHWESRKRAKKSTRRSNRMRVKLGEAKKGVAKAQKQSQDIISEACKQLQNAHDKIQLLEGTQKTIDSRNQALQDQVKELRAELDDKPKGEEALKTQVEALQQRADAAEKERDDIQTAADAEYEFLQDDCNNLEKDKIGLEERIREVTKERDDQQLTFSYLQADYSRLEEQCAKSAEDAGKETANVRKDRDELKAENERVKTEKASLEDSVMATSDATKQELADAQKTITELRRELVNHEADSAESEKVLEDRIDELQAELSQTNLDHHAKALAMNQKNETLATQVSALEKAKNEAVGNNMRLITDNEKLNKDLSVLKSAKPTYNGEKYDTVDHERRALQRRLADQKIELLKAQADARSLERDNAALRKQLQDLEKDSKKTDSDDDEKDDDSKDNDEDDNGAGGPDGGAGKLPESKDDQKDSGDDQEDDNQEGGNGRDEGDEKNENLVPDDGAGKLPTDPSAANQASRDDVDLSSPSPLASTSAPGFNPVTSDFIPSQPNSKSPLSASAPDFVPKPSQDPASSMPEASTPHEDYMIKHIGDPTAGKDGTASLLEEEFRKRQKQLDDMIAKGNDRAKVTLEATRKAGEARFTTDYFPGATEKTEDEHVSQAIADELENLPSNFLGQSMWAPKAPIAKGQLPTSAQQKPGPANPRPANTNAPQPVSTHTPLPAAGPPAHQTLVAQGLTALNQGPNAPPAPLGDRSFHGTPLTGPRNQGRGGQGGRGSFNNGRSGHGRGQHHQAPQGGTEPPTKPAAMRKKNRKPLPYVMPPQPPGRGHRPPQLPPHLRGNSPTTPPTRGNQPPPSGQELPGRPQEQKEKEEGK